MELRQLRYVIGIGEAGSLLAASRALHVVQPALSHQVAVVERELGTALFVRSHRGMQLTAAGRAFVAHARAVLQDVERLRSAVREVDRQVGGTVVLGLPTTVALVATLPILGAPRPRHRRRAGPAWARPSASRGRRNAGRTLRPLAGP